MKAAYKQILKETATMLARQAAHKRVGGTVNPWGEINVSIPAYVLSQCFDLEYKEVVDELWTKAQEYDIAIMCNVRSHIDEENF